jgi:hypothetical protein
MATTITRNALVRTSDGVGDPPGGRAVSVVVSFSLVGPDPVWSFSPDSVELPPGRNTINFTLNTTTGFLFDNWFSPTSAQGASFSYAVDATGTVLTVTDVNTLQQGQNAVTIPYSVAVANAAGARYVSDPTIKNDPPDPPLN